jgi:REP element-mobilizing transposase RayT
LIFRFFRNFSQHFLALADMFSVTAPRQIIPGQTYMVTRRVSERRFLLRPDKVVNNIVEYCIALAAKKAQVLLHCLVVLANHYHLEATDPSGNLPDFLREANRMIAQCLNRYWGRDEALWSSDKPSVVSLVDDGSMLEKLIYITLNPVRAGLVSDYRQWPGLLYSARDWLKNPKKVKRPEFFFNATITDDSEVQLSFVPLPALANKNLALAYQTIEEAICERQRAIRAEFEKMGGKFVGIKRVLKVNPSERPTTREPSNTLRPCLSASDPRTMKKAKERLKYFRCMYREALSKLRTGIDVVFPYGTYWYCRFLKVACEPAYTVQLLL